MVETVTRSHFWEDKLGEKKKKSYKGKLIRRDDLKVNLTCVRVNKTAIKTKHREDHNRKNNDFQCCKPKTWANLIER